MNRTDNHDKKRLLLHLSSLIEFDLCKNYKCMCNDKALSSQKTFQRRTTCTSLFLINVGQVS